MMHPEDIEAIVAALVDRLAGRRISGSGPRLMNIAEAAAYIGRTVDATRQMVKRARIPVTRIDGKVQVDRVRLDRLIEESTRYEA